jgi:hypothetical protein
MTKTDVIGIKGLGNSLATKLNKVQKDLLNEGLETHKAMHASNLFKGLGSKKLLKIITNVKDYYNTTLE